MSEAAQIVSTDVPKESRVGKIYPHTDLADAFEVRLPPGTSTDPETLARFVLLNQPAWITPLMKLRDAIVRNFGLKTSTHLQRAPGERIGIFKIYERRDSEILLGEDDSHLDFRLSVLHRSRQLASGRASFVVLSTVVHCHNRLGRLYIFVIAPFHRLVVKGGLRRASRLGWPKAV